MQRHIRGFVRRKGYLNALHTRLHSAMLMQRVTRRYLARCLAYSLRLQQSAIYEQLWDERNQIVYYYNRVSKTSTYEPPNEPFRPLVRDFYSDALIQAWPQLETPNTYLAPEVPIEQSVCSICRVRKPIRFCKDCPFLNSYGRINYATYCFPCYTSIHINDKENHHYEDLEPPVLEYLKCVECDLPATRKCQGCISDNRLKALCGQLKQRPVHEWEEILRTAKLFEERKLKLFMSGLQSSRNISAALQWQLIKTHLERIKTECDECYCYDCYKDIHSGGKRLNHVWLGFREYSPVCSCNRSPKQLQCIDCGDAWCDACYKVLHSMGRKRKHKSVLVLENNPFNAPFCNECSRRVGTIPCARNCGFVGCDSCYECIHIDQCPNRGLNEPDGHYCVVCGELADSRCLECNDLYCSRKWMGNPGCFAKNHKRGNRVKHKMLALI